MRAGDEVRALDVPPPVGAAAGNEQFNITDRQPNFGPGDPEVGVTFTAPTSGAVLLIVGGGIRDDDPNNGDRGHLAPEVFLGVDDTGPVVVTPVVSHNSFTSSGDPSALYQYGSRMKPLTGLIPGETYFARVTQSVNSGAAEPPTVDLHVRQVFAVPIAG